MTSTKRIGGTINIMMKFKAVMLKKGLRKAQTKCPVCKSEGTTLKGSLSKPMWMRGRMSQHFSMRCTTKGCIWGME